MPRAPGCPSAAGRPATVHARGRRPGGLTRARPHDDSSSNRISSHPGSASCRCLKSDDIVIPNRIASPAAAIAKDKLQ